MPRTEDLLTTLNGGQKFSKLDLSHAYQQLLLDNESREYLTVNTHSGLFQPTRLQFGVHSASGVFQREMEKRLSHKPFTSVRVDDILVSGRSDAEHLSNLKAVLQVIEDCGLRLKRSKCVFMTPEVTYLGFRVNKEGTTPVDDNIAAVMNAPEPVNASQLKFFVGMLNYYHRHLPSLAHTLESLYSLLRKNVKWKWEEQQQVVFKAAKQMLCSATLLVHYDPEKPLILHCDASPYGLGSVLARTMQDGAERPIAYASRTLPAPERNYSQILKEGLAVIYSVKKFHQYLFGRHVTIVRD